MPRLLRRPPRIKYLEAAGALADGRVRVLEESPEGVLRARITSSTGERVYHVALVIEDGSVRAYSNDNGTRLRGYVGYPILALLMLAGKLPRDPAVEEALKGIPWKKLNEKYKKYDLVIEEVKRITESRGVAGERLEEFMRRASRSLSSIRVYFDESLGRGSLTDYF
ncbi:MAG: hypothetical protein F7C33_02385 [Desulfurococcales archaeon]|nr:hypothetical protein [Desulfurococcales archaeon]